MGRINSADMKGLEAVTSNEKTGNGGPLSSYDHSEELRTLGLLQGAQARFYRIRFPVSFILAKYFCFDKIWEPT